MATLDLDPGLLRDGWNTIELVWPQPSWTAGIHLERIVASLELGEIPELFPVYGELQAFSASACAAPC